LGEKVKEAGSQKEKKEKRREMAALALDRRSDRVPVGILRQSEYDRPALKEIINTLAHSLEFEVSRGARVLLKPNLISVKRKDGLACTHGEFIAAVAEWFIDQGARVSVGDSPAFGKARGVMAAMGISQALDGLPVEKVDFLDSVEKRLAGGVKVRVARQAFDCDLLVNLPKCKAHCQLLVTLGVKNLFGTVLGWRKPWLHMRYGESPEDFCAIIVDLLSLFPRSVTFMDGIIALHRNGPINGEPYPLGLVAGCVYPAALDTAFLHILGVDPEQSPLWQECRRQGLQGTDLEALDFPLLAPDSIDASEFALPDLLQPISFRPRRVLSGALKRMYAHVIAK
jgi:uncharacterized protein (DUF362 family)